MHSRRHVLSLLSAAPFAPTLAGCTPSNLPDPAAGWRNPGAAETDVRRFALAHAILAPNPHNTQPWQVALSGEDEMLLYCDLERRLPFTDPLDRQITIGHGCFLEHYRIAAAQRGLYAEMTPFPEGEPLPRLDARTLAHVKLVQLDPPTQPSEDPLFAQITARRTNREVYDVTRPPSAADFDALDSVVTNTGEEYPGGVFWTAESAKVTELRDLVWRAFDREMHTIGALEETYQWLRFGREDVARHRDGLAIEGAIMPLFKALGFVSREAMTDPESQSNKSALVDWKKKAESAPAFLWLTTMDDTPGSRLGAGRAYARLALTAQSLGLAIHPWSQALQEYEEMAGLYAEAKQVLGAGDQTVQMLVRIGHADPVAPSARRDLGEFIRA
jgi:hypothetical protein